MHIWDKSSRQILSLLLSSTAHVHHFTEIEEGSSLTAPTVTKYLTALTAAEILFRKEEGYAGESEFRAGRVYYTLNPDMIPVLRMEPSLSGGSFRRST